MKHLLNHALHEIEDLRRRNELLQAQVDVVSVFAAALLGKPQQMGAAPDVAWALRRKIQEIESDPPATN